MTIADTGGTFGAGGETAAPSVPYTPGRTPLNVAAAQVAATLKHRAVTPGILAGLARLADFFGLMTLSLTIAWMYVTPRDADDIGYWLAGKPGSNPTAGKVHGKEEMAAIFRRMTRALKDGRLRMQVKQTTAEGDRVAVEVESHGELANGRVYNQEYHVLMTIRGGKIAAAREYMDTAHVDAVWYRP